MNAEPIRISTLSSAKRTSPVDRLKSMILVLDEATAICEHERLEIYIPSSLYRYSNLLPVWRDRTIEVKMTYEGKVLDFAISLAERSCVPPCIQLDVTVGEETRVLTPQETITLSPSDAKKSIVFLMEYFHCFSMKIITKS